MGNKVCCQDNKGLEDDINQEVEHPIRLVPYEDQGQAQALKPIKLPVLSQNVHNAMMQKKFFQKELNQIPKKHILHQNDNYYNGQLNQAKKPHGFGQAYRECTNPITHQVCNSLYVGHFDNGRAHGQGAYIYSDGSYYQGQFRNNLPQGNGKYTKNTSAMFYEFEGEFKNGRKHKGILKWNHQPEKIHEQNSENLKKIQYKYIYEGTFDEYEEFDGLGTLTDDKGVYKGQFKNGQKNGNGKYFIFIDGKQTLRYDGSYKNDKKQGLGTVYKHCGTKIAYQGSMKEDLPHGQGKVYSSDGVKQAQFYLGINKQYIQIAQ